MRIARLITFAVALLLLCGFVVRNAATPSPGCPAYHRVAGGWTLVAHAGGGLPDRTYANNLAALDASYAAGFRLFEIDFRQKPWGGLAIGHDMIDIVRLHPTTIDDILGWLRRHHDALIITDFKTDNVAGLRDLAALAPDLKTRIIPQIYQPSELAGIAAFGFHKPIFTLYRNRDPNWLSFANHADLFAVTMPEGSARYAPSVHKPVFLHTVNVEREYPGVAGVYTDCLRPRRSAA